MMTWLFWFLCENEVYTDSFFGEIVLKVLPNKHFTIPSAKIITQSREEPNGESRWGCLVFYSWLQCPISKGLSYHHYNKITIDRVTAVNTPRGSGLSCQLKADVQYLRQCGLGVSPSRATISQSHSRYRVLWVSATDGIQESM